MTETTDSAETREPHATTRRWRPWRWVIAGIVMVLLTLVAIPLKVASDCQRILDASHAAGGKLESVSGGYSYPYLGHWPSAAKNGLKQALPRGMQCLDRLHLQCFSFDESAAIDDHWLLEQNFSALPCVVQVHIRNPRIGDVGIESLATVGTLHNLVVSGTSLTDEGLITFSSHPALTVLGLHQTKVTATSLPVLASMPRLAGLVVSCTGIVGDELAALRTCAELRLLAVDASQLTEPFLSSLSTFPNLTHLTVLSSTSGPDAGLAQEAFGSGTHVVMDDSLLQRILKETTITTVWIEDGSGITDASVPALLKAGHIQRLDIWDVGMSADGASKVNSVHNSVIGGKPALRLLGESKVERDEYASRYK